jgi:IclR family transcriptional regulator, mhp operon transcriptional activator
MRASSTPSAPASSTAYRYCQSLVKGLDLLATLNRLPAGSGSITELARLTSVHRTTIKRLLETLREEGYVEADPLTGHYRLTFRVQRLSYGFKDTVAITEIAWPFMRTLSKELVWPCSLSSQEGDSMVIRSSTRSYSPLSFHPGMPGRRLPMLTTSAGRAFFSFSSTEEQETLLEIIQSGDEVDAALASDNGWIKQMLTQTRKRGFAVNRGDWGEEPKFGGVAVPIIHQGRVLASLNIIFLLRAVNDIKSIQRIADALLKTAHQIQEKFSQRKNSLRP